MKRIGKLTCTYHIKVAKNGKTVLSAFTRKLGRFSRLIQAEHFSEPNTEVYIRVSSGKQTDNDGEMTDFVNEGTYTEKDRLMTAYRAFLEVAR